MDVVLSEVRRDAEVIGVNIVRADDTARFSWELLARMDPRLGAYDAETKNITLKGLNRTVAYHVDSSESYWANATLIYDDYA